MLLCRRRSRPGRWPPWPARHSAADPPPFRARSRYRRKTGRPPPRSVPDRIHRRPVSGPGRRSGCPPSQHRRCRRRRWRARRRRYSGRERPAQGAIGIHRVQVAVKAANVDDTVAVRGRGREGAGAHAKYPPYRAIGVDGVEVPVARAHVDDPVGAYQRRAPHGIAGAGCPLERALLRSRDDAETISPRYDRSVWRTPSRRKQRSPDGMLGNERRHRCPASSALRRCTNRSTWR